ncbi:MAG: hypothetical protein JXR36_14850 [Bacteroidales bacterium]|nr:hypothetical protein [Bacteroidales bacterium]
MPLIISGNTRDLVSVYQILQDKYPNLKVINENKSTVVVLNKTISAVVRFKSDKLYIYGDINLKNALNLVLLIVGVLIGIVGVAFVFAIMQLVYMKQIKAFKSDVYKALT